MLACVSGLLMAQEILAVRAAKIAFGYGFEFFILPLTLLGLAVGGILTHVYIRNASPRPSSQWLLCLLTLSIVVPLLATRFSFELGIGLAEVVFFVGTFIHFVFYGSALSYLFSLRPQRAAHLYYADLVGAGVGVAITLIFLDVFGFDAVRTFLYIVLGTVVSSAWLASMQRLLSVGLAALTCLLVLSVPFWYGLHIPCAYFAHLATKSNSYSQTDTYPFNRFVTERYQELRITPAILNAFPSIQLYVLRTDCAAGSNYVVKYDSLSDISFLKDSVRSIPFALRENSLQEVLVLGSGSGLDVTRARLFDATNITAVEINPTVIAAYSELTGGGIYTDPAVNLVIDDARRYAETTRERFDLISLAKASRYGNTASLAGSPHYVYTEEALNAYIALLKPDGVLAMVLMPFIDEEVTNTLVHLLKKNGVNPQERLLRIEREATEEMIVLYKNGSFTDHEKDIVRTRLKPPSTFEENYFRGYTSTSVDLDDVRRVTDDRPFISALAESHHPWSLSLSTRNKIVLSISVVILALFILSAPWLLYRTRVDVGNSLVAPAIAMFSIGVGFMALEVILIQKFGLVFGNPTYSLGIVLIALLWGAGTGGLLSRCVIVRKQRRGVLFALAAALLMVLGLAYSLDSVTHTLLVQSWWVRVIVTTGLLFLLSLPLGIFFPILLQEGGADSAHTVPWLWTVNASGAIVGGVSAEVATAAIGFRASLIIVIVSYALAGALIFYYQHQKKESDKRVLRKSD